MQYFARTPSNNLERKEWHMYPKLTNLAATLPGLVLALGMTACNLVGLTTDAAAGTLKGNPPLHRGASSPA